MVEFATRTGAVATAVGWTRLVLGGLVAAAILALLTMTIEATIGDEGFWAPLWYAAAVLLRDLQTVAPHPGFAPLPVVLGAVIHLVTSLVLALVFGLLVPRMLHPRGWLVAAGIAWGAVVFGLMWYALLPAVNDVMLRLNGPWFAAAHLVWGGLVGLLVPRYVS